MSVRALTIDEMLSMKEGEQAVIVECFDGVYESGQTVVRTPSFADDKQSAAFKVAGQDYSDYFKEGEIGVVEVQASTEPQYAVEHLVTGQPEHEIKVDLGMFRPELSTRKVGKIRVELVDHGFPRALREVAKVMTWAQTAKGYKDHDWQNLPNAEVALEAAASRHRTDHIEQRVVEGYTIERCVDHESGLLHKAHEAFGVLAQLELMLRGEFDRGVDLTH